MLNLSGSGDVDVLKVTDTLAAEFLAFPGVSVVPVNLTLAALELAGKGRVETAEDALWLARELGADGTVVAAITDFSPYDPPRIGLVAQWYPTGRLRWAEAAAGDSARPPSVAAVRLSGDAVSGPVLQVQRQFNASDEVTLREVREFAAARGGDQSPYAWRRYTKSQELFIRYCCWALIRTMVSENGLSPPASAGSE